MRFLNSRYTDLSCLKLLLENGANPHKKCSNTGETPWSFAKEIGYLPIPEILELLADAAKLRNTGRNRNP